MDLQEVIEHLCKTAALAYHSIGDYSHPNDCICTPHDNIFGDGYQNSGKIPEYVRDAVKEKLLRDGFELDQSAFNEPI